MTGEVSMRKNKVEKPATTFEKPIDVVHDSELSPDEKKRALNTWEQDARQELTASNEGMPGPDEGLKQSDANKLDQVEHAKRKIGSKPKHKPAH
jgi:hypothetical protein